MSLSNCGSSVHMLTGCSSVYTASSKNTGVAAICNSFIILVFTLHKKNYARAYSESVYEHAHTRAVKKNLLAVRLLYAHVK